MAESVSVEHGGVTVTTNTASEADLRAELEAPPAPVSRETPDQPPPPRGRDAGGRFVKGTPAAEAVDTPPAELPDPATPDPGAEGEDLARHNPRTRMLRALEQKTKAERRAAALEAELQQLRSAPPPPPPQAPPMRPSGPLEGEPLFEQFIQEADPYTSYLQAWARWDNQRQLEERFSRYDQERAEHAKAESFQARLASGRTAYPDFEQALTQADQLGLQVSAVMREAIADSPRAADLVYYLATHPEECLQLAEESVQTPVAAASLMRRVLENQLTPRAAASEGGPGSAARVVQSRAKPPVTPVGSSPVVADEPPGESASAADHARYWNRKLKVPGTR